MSRRSFPAIAPRRHAPEPLEDRRHLSVARDANGYTVVTPSADSRIIYLSSSTGSDKNNGLTPATAVATIPKGQTLLRNGMPDQLLLKRGDVFHGVFSYWGLSGRSASEPMLVGAYGTGARPLVDCGTGTAAFMSSSEGSASFVDVIGVGFDPLYRDPNSSLYDPTKVGGTTGFRWYVPGGGHVLVEDCAFNYFKLNLDFEYGGTDFTVRRCVINNSYAINSHSQGIYANNVTYLTVEQNTFDHDGWLAGVSGAGQAGYNHAMYFSAATGHMTVRDNVIANASFSGVMARSGGDITGNLFVNCPIALVFGNANGSDSTPGGVTGSILNNVLSGTGYFGTSPYGQGMEIGNTKPGGHLLVSGNVFTGDTQLAGAALTMTMATDTLTPGVAVGENDVTVTHNVFNGFAYSVQIDGRFNPGGTGLYGLTDVNVVDNDLVNAKAAIVRHDGAYDPAQEHFAANRYYSVNAAQQAWARLQTVSIGIAPWLAAYDRTGTVLPALPYADPTRTAATYDAALGGTGTIADLMAQASLMSPGNYRTEYMAPAITAYVRAGFGLDAAPPTVTAIAIAMPAIALGATTGTITVTYVDDYAVDPATVATGDLLVTGPGGAALVPTLTAATTTPLPAGGQQVVATYAVAPVAAWADGTYAVQLLPGAVADRAGNAAAAAALGTFAVDLTPPVVSAVAAPAVTAADPAAPPYTFAVTYADPSGINAASLSSNQVQVTGPNGFAQTARLTGTSTTATTATATYAIAPPPGGWTADANGSYTLTLAGEAVRDTVGNALSTASLGAFTVAIAVPTPATFTLAGRAYVDANANGRRDSREAGLAGVTVFLDLAGTGAFAAGDPTAVTAADGSYAFAGLAAGTYTVLAVAPAGYAAVKSSVPVTLSADTTSADVGFQVAPTRVNQTPPGTVIVRKPVGGVTVPVFVSGTPLSDLLAL